MKDKNDDDKNDDDKIKNFFTLGEYEKSLEVTLKKQKGGPFKGHFLIEYLKENRQAVFHCEEYNESSKVVGYNCSNLTFNQYFLVN